MLFYKTSTEKLKYNLMSFILTWSGLVILMSMFVTIPLTLIFVHELHISETSATWIGSIYSLCFATGCLIYGPLSDKYGRKIFLVIGIITLTIGTFITGFIQQFEIVLIMRAIQGFAAAAFAPLSLVYVSEVFPFEKRLSVTGYISSGFLMAAVVAQVFGITVNSLYNWQAIFLFLGIIYFITALLVIFYLPNDRVADTEKSLLNRYIQMKYLFKNSKLCISFFIMFTLYFTLMGMYTLLGRYLQSEFNFTEENILFVRALGIFSMLACVFAGKAGNHFGVLRLLQLALILAGVSLFLMGFSKIPTLIILFSLLFVAGIAGVVPLNISLVVKNSGAVRGSAVLFNAFSLFLGASVGPLVASHLIQKGIIDLAFIVFSVVLFIGLILSVFLREGTFNDI
ncbi:MAG: MFS transporter [Lysinibacillus sp.]|nr:MFS transporter [Lysinibacillus sp.]